ncbi:unnamed protein product [Rodentolepis nana]|uniref:Tetraspanin n=1 Tax=Rodentolepis nana TaxID=102285 RepID=A0A3P7RS94_RODNA|nr:unnamed protein product [Rodentolepis nana]
MRILLLVFNLLVFVAGGIMTGFGVIMVLVVAFLVIGCLIFVTGFLGCLGAWKKSKCLLRLFATVLVLIIIAEIACGVILIVNKDKFKPFIREFFTNAIAEIESNPNSGLTVPIIGLQDSGCVEKIVHELKANSIGIGAGVVEIETIVAALILAKQSE